MNELLENKYECWEAEYGGIYDTRIRNGYGYVRVKNPYYTPYEDEREFLLRKPTPKERREIIINTVIECNGRTFKVSALAKRLGVSDRTVQMTLRQLEKEEIIRISPMFTKRGKQKGNSYRYVGLPCKKYGSGLTLQTLYDKKQNTGFRDWAWKEYEFRHNKVWHDDVYALCRKKFETRIARRKYLERNNLPLVVPEDIKYLVLRYCYWKGKYENRWKDDNFSQDGTVKLSIFPLNRRETVHIYRYTFVVEFGGTKDNPEITVYEADMGKELSAFSWFNENVIQSSKELGENLIEQFFILGDFTTK